MDELSSQKLVMLLLSAAQQGGVKNMLPTSPMSPFVRKVLETGIQWGLMAYEDGQLIITRWGKSYLSDAVAALTK